MTASKFIWITILSAIFGAGLLGSLAQKNTVGGVVSGIWLVVLHEWWPLITGSLSLFFATLLISLALLPAYLLILPASKLFERGHIILGSFLAFPVSVYTTFIMVAWCLGMFESFSDMPSPRTLVPRLRLAYHYDFRMKSGLIGRDFTRPLTPEEQSAIALEMEKGQRQGTQVR